MRVSIAFPRSSKLSLVPLNSVFLFRYRNTISNQSPLIFSLSNLFNIQLNIISCMMQHGDNKIIYILL